MTKPKPIGKRGEEFIARTCEFSFLPDFVFPNPRYRRGRFERELCDAVLAFERTLILIQIKTAEPTAHKHFSPEDEFNWRKKQVDKALGQLDGAANTLFRGHAVTAIDRRSDPITFTSDGFDHVYGLGVIDTEAPQVHELAPFQSVPKTRKIDSLFLTFAEFIELCTELTTIGDLLDYLAFRLERCRSAIFMGGGELDLLAIFRSNRPDFAQSGPCPDMILVQDGIWEQHKRNLQVVRRNEADRISYIVDDIVARLHTSVQFTDPDAIDFDLLETSNLPKAAQYREIVTELARLRRVERRSIGEKLVDKSRLYIPGERTRYFVIEYEHRLPVLFMIGNRDGKGRLMSLSTIGAGACLHRGYEKLLGIATEPLNVEKRSVDAILFDGPLIRRAVNDVDPDAAKSAARMFKPGKRDTIKEFDPDLRPAKTPVSVKRGQTFKKRRRRNR